MSFIDESRLEKITANLCLGQNAVSDSQLLGNARNYKKRVASRYRLFNEGDIKHLESKDLFASLKLDGQLHFLYKDKSECFLFNIKGRAITELPLLKEANKLLENVEQVLIPGELYFVNEDGSRGRVYDVTRALGAKAKGKEENLRFAAFDLIELNNEFVGAKKFKQKHEELKKWFSTNGMIHRIEIHEVDNQSLSQLFNKHVSEGGEEGLVCVDAENHTVYKIKPRHNVDAVIIGFTESPDTPDSLRVLLTGLMRPDGSIQVFAKVGTGFDDEQRRAIFRQLKPMAVASSYNTTDRNHTLFTMVRPEIVIEMAFHDLIYENASGKPEMKALLNYDANNGYTPQLPEAFVSVLGPVFKRFREDKEANPVDLRLTQLANFVDLDNLEKHARSLDLAKSNLLHREVYTKTTKGLVSVRKFVTWKTNKEEFDENFPSYVLCYVDYSPGRASPLKRVIRTAPTRAAIEQLLEKFKENEIKRGWKAAVPE